MEEEIDAGKLFQKQMKLVLTKILFHYEKNLNKISKLITFAFSIYCCSTIFRNYAKLEVSVISIASPF